MSLTLFDYLIKHSSKYGKTRLLLVTIPSNNNIIIAKNMPRTLKNTDYQKGIGKGKFGDIRIGTWSIRTFFKTSAMKTIIDGVKRYKLPVVALQEIRFAGNGSIKSNDTTLFYSGGTGDRHEFGVGFVINEVLLTKVTKFEAIN